MHLWCGAALHCTQSSQFLKLRGTVVSFKVLELPIILSLSTFCNVIIKQFFPHNHTVAMYLKLSIPIKWNKFNQKHGKGGNCFKRSKCGRA